MKNPLIYIRKSLSRRLSIIIVLIATIIFVAALGFVFIESRKAVRQEAINRAIHLGSGGLLTVRAPFITMTKAQVVAQGLQRNVPYELTWSCYEGGERPCGTCGTCRDRIAAFRENGVEDPALNS